MTYRQQLAAMYVDAAPYVPDPAFIAHYRGSCDATCAYCAANRDERRREAAERDLAHRSDLYGLDPQLPQLPL